jgi:tRNA U55 pseudouridine synthase TruB
MGNLTRTRSGPFSLNDAVTLDELQENLHAFIWPVEKAIPYPRAFIQPEAETKALNGNPVPLSMVAFTVSASEKYWTYLGDRLIGLYKKAHERFIPEVMMI